MLTRGAPAHGRDQTMPKGFANMASGERLTTPEWRPRKMVTSRIIQSSFLPSNGGKRNCARAAPVPRWRGRNQRRHLGCLGRDHASLRSLHRHIVRSFDAAPSDCPFEERGELSVDRNSNKSMLCGKPHVLTSVSSRPAGRPRLTAKNI